MICNDEWKSKLERVHYAALDTADKIAENLKSYCGDNIGLRAQMLDDLKDASKVVYNTYYILEAAEEKHAAK